MATLPGLSFYLRNCSDYHKPDQGLLNKGRFQSEEEGEEKLWDLTTGEGRGTCPILL